MKATRVDISKMHVIRLETNEEVIITLQEYVRKLGINGGSISGIGSLSDVELALYDGSEYRTFRVEEMLELSSSMGNISWLGDSPVIHLHAVVSNIDGRCWAGHLVKGTVSFTAEFIIQESTEKLQRARDEGTGLNLLAL